MSTSLKAYYLQQMGIETWVRRSVLPRVSGVHVVAPKHAESLVLVVLEGGELDEASQWVAGAAGRLLKNMLQSIGLSPENTALVFGASSSMVDVVKAHVVRLEPRVILVLEQTSTTGVGLRLATCTTQIVNSIHPMDLLMQPLRKKSVYSDLLQVKTLFSASVIVSPSVVASEARQSRVPSFEPWIASCLATTPDTTLHIL